jgi:hypothetical protein
MTLDEFMASTDWDLLKAVNGWDVIRDGDRLLFELTARDGERYLVRIMCDDLPRRAPSVVFVDAEGSPSALRAWPKGNGRFFEVVKLPPHSFLCMPLTREGLQHHPQWLEVPTITAWRGERSTLMEVLNYLQRLLSSADYAGRAS